MIKMRTDLIVAQEVPQEYVDLAKRMFLTKQELIKRLSIAIPKKWFILKDDKCILLNEYSSPKFYNIYEFIRSLKEYRTEARQYVEDALANILYREVVIKGIPLEVFEQGAMCYGFFDKIAYFGQYYLSMCNIRAIACGIEAIKWGEVSIKYYINHIEKIERSMDSLEETMDNAKNISCIHTSMIHGYTGNRMLLSWNNLDYPFAVCGAQATYRDCCVEWMLDRVNLKSKNDFGGSLSTSQFLIRPVAIATIKAMKELAKRIYLGQIDIYDGGDDMPSLDYEYSGFEPKYPKYDAIRCTKELYAEKQLEGMTTDNNIPKVFFDIFGIPIPDNDDLDKSTNAA